MSEFYNIFLYFFIFSISLLMRWYSSLNLRIDFDTYGHLYYTKELNKIKSSPWSAIKIQCWSGENFSHPFFLHWLLSFLPQEMLLKRQRWVNIIMDSFFVVVIFTIANHKLRSFELSILVILVYSFMPLTYTKTSIGPRLNNFTPRLFTEILFNLLALMILYSSSLDFYLYFILLIILISAILLTSKFGVQVIVFILPMYSLLSSDYWPLFAVLISFILLTIVSGGKVIFQINRQFNHLYEYFIYNKSLGNPNRDKNKFIFPTIADLIDSGKLKLLLRNYLFYNSYTVVLFKFPIFIIYISFFISYLLGAIFYFDVNNSLILILCTLCAFLLTSSKKFLFLGESERYLNHVSVVIIIGCLKILQQNNYLYLAYIMVLYGLMFWVAENLLYRKFTKSDDRAEADDEMERILNHIKKPLTISCSSYHNFSVYRLMLNTGHYPIFPYHMNKDTRTRFTKNLEYKYPFLDLSKTQEIIDFTLCSGIILDINSLNQNNIMKFSVPLDWHEVKLDKGIYRLYLKDNLCFDGLRSHSRV